AASPPASPSAASVGAASAASVGAASAASVGAAYSALAGAASLASARSSAGASVGAFVSSAFVSSAFASSALTFAALAGLSSAAAFLTVFFFGVVASDFGSPCTSASAASNAARLSALGSATFKVPSAPGRPLY